MSESANKFGYGGNTTTGGQSQMSRMSLSKTSVPMIDDFVNHMSGMSSVLASTTVKELITNLGTALKRIFKVARVSFLLQDKGIIDFLRRENARMKLF